MKVKIDTALRAALLAVALWGAAPALTQERADDEGVLLDQIVALVNDDVLTRRELQGRVEQVARQLKGRVPPGEVLRRQVLERMIVEKVQLQLAANSGIRIDDITLNRTIQDIANRNGMDLDGLRSALMQDGIDWEDFRAQIRTELTISRLRQRQVDSRLTVTDQEIDDFIANQGGAIEQDVEYRLAQILISVPEAASPEQIKSARDKAEGLRQRILGGEDFADIAARESEGQNALEGGDLGWRAAGEIPTLFARSVALMQPGEVSELIRSPSGFHIVKLTDRRGGARRLVTQTHARHILVQPNAMLSEEDARRRLLTLRQRIVNGEDFAALARANSDDKGSAVSGGDLGWADPGNFVPEFEEVMNSLPPGGLSEPFRSQFGWHIVQVIERRTQDNTREQLRAQAREYIRNRKQEEELDIWLRRLRDEAYVEYRIEGLAPEARGS